MHLDIDVLDNQTLQEALTYRHQGFSVIPLWPRQKKPALGEGTIARYREQVASERTLRHWFGGEARNIGIITGRVSHIIVLDVDGDEGRHSLKGLAMPPTPVVLTARGHHAYFRHPGGYIGSAIKAMPGVDILAEKRYVVAPPSIHPDGPIYEWHEFLPLSHTDFAPPPRWLIELFYALGKIQRGAPLPMKPLGHEPGEPPQFLPPISVPSPLYPPGVASKNMFLLATPPMEGEAPDWLGELVQRPDIALACARVLGVPVDPVGKTFRCILPGHEEKQPSASLHWDPKTGVLKYRDWHRRSRHEWFRLPEVRASLAYGEVVRLRGPSIAVWQLRLLVEARILSPAIVPARRLPESIRPSIRKVYEGFLLLLGCKWLHTPLAPTVFSWRFAMAWCGVTSMTTISEAMQWLLEHRFIRQMGVWKRSALFLPVQSEVPGQLKKETNRG